MEGMSRKQNTKNTDVQTKIINLRTLRKDRNGHGCNYSFGSEVKDKEQSDAL